jgi:hypothetical protein
VPVLPPLGIVVYAPPVPVLPPLGIVVYAPPLPVLPPLGIVVYAPPLPVLPPVGTDPPTPAASGRLEVPSEWPESAQPATRPKHAKAAS